ncbi:MAG: hypothetical protein NZ874_08260 [Fimbriimonadales bacterium]|nr:hypothetical protein [Fimbriimonadales bacterium]
MDECLRVLKRILAIDDPSCRGAALHGLGHLHYPEGWKLVQAYIQGEFSEAGLERLRTCRDGVVM